MSSALGAEQGLGGWSGSCGNIHTMRGTLGHEVWAACLQVCTSKVKSRSKPLVLLHYQDLNSSASRSLTMQSAGLENHRLIRI